jgi:hypothetical protein
MNNALKRWMAKASPEEKSKLAKLLDISRGSLQWIAGAYRTDGKIDVDATLAREIEAATTKLGREGLEPVPREKLCAACGRCEYAKKARAES